MMSREDGIRWLLDHGFTPDRPGSWVQPTGTIVLRVQVPYLADAKWIAGMQGNRITAEQASPEDAIRQLLGVARRIVAGIELLAIPSGGAS